MALAWAGAMVAAPLNGLRVWYFSVCEVLLAVAVAGTIAVPTLRRRELDVSGYGGVLAGLGLMAAGGLLAAAVATASVASLVATVSFVAATVGSVLAWLLWAPSRIQLRWFCALWLGAAVVSSLWALGADGTVAGRHLGLASHPNSLGLVCVLGTGLALGLAFDGGNRLNRYVAGAACLALLGGLLSSGSRAALLGLVSAVPAVAVLSSRRRVALASAVVAAAVGAAVLVGVLVTPTQGQVGRFTGDISTAESDARRLEQLDRGLDRVAENPVTGAGFEFAGEVHSIYLQSLVAAGPLGLVGLLVASCSVLVTARRRLAAEPETVGGDRGLLAGMAGGYVGYLVAGAFQNSLSARHVWLYVAATLALARPSTATGDDHQGEGVR